MVGARLGKTLPSPFGSLDKLNLPFRTAGRLAGAARCTHLAEPLLAGATRRRSCQYVARSQQDGFAADYPCTVWALIYLITACTDSHRSLLRLVLIVFSSSLLFLVYVSGTFIFIVLS